jgi:ribosomal protein L37AE/L43A
MIPINRPKSGFYIGVTCPGCGAALELQSDFFILTCSHCGSVLRIVLPDIPPCYLVPGKISQNEVLFHLDHYLKQNNFPLSPSRIEISPLYYPYWKIDAVVLKLRNRIEERVIARENSYEQDIMLKQPKTDINLTPFSATLAAGPARDDIPYSIGLRAEYIRMTPFSQENVEEGFDCLPVEKSWRETQSALEKNISHLGNISIPDFGKNKTVLFHPTGSIIYFPYYLAECKLKEKNHRFVIDAVTGRVLNDTVTDTSSSPAMVSSASVPFGKLGIELHRCPDCGVDLPSRQSYIYICRNCHHLTSLEKNPLFQNKIFAAAIGDNKADRLFPFWSLKLSPESSEKLKTMFGGIYESDCLVIPAFKMPNFEAMFRLSKRISGALPKINLLPVDNIDLRYLAVTLSPSEALTMAEVIVYREEISRDRNREVEKRPFWPQEISLFYAPFHPENYFYVDSVLGAITFEKSLAPA